MDNRRRNQKERQSAHGLREIKRHDYKAIERAIKRVENVVKNAEWPKKIKDSKIS